MDKLNRRTYWVDYELGDDANGGLTPDKPFKLLSAAISAAEIYRATCTNVHTRILIIVSVTRQSPDEEQGGTVPLERFFNLLTKWWKTDPYVSAASDPAILQAHPAFKAIIGEGPRIAPMILRDYQSDPEAPWDLALELIFPDVTFAEQHRGSPKLIREDWLAWGSTGNPFAGGAK